MSSMMMYVGDFGDSQGLFLIPISIDAPYQMGIYMPNIDVLTVSSVMKNSGFETYPQKGEDGNYKTFPQKQGEPLRYKLKEVLVEKPIQHQIEDREAIKHLFKSLASNYSEELLNRQFEISDNIAKLRKQEEDNKLVDVTPQLIGGNEQGAKPSLITVHK